MRLNPRSRITKLIYRLDDLLALALNLCFLLAVLALAALRRAWRFALRRPAAVPGQVLFLSSEGHKVAPTRVRSYHFCQTMQRQGVDAFVLAYWDEFAALRHFPFPFRRIWEVEKLVYNVATFFWLALKGPLVVIEQRPNHGFVVPLYLKLFNGSRVYMDIDDWILDYLVARPFVRREVRHMLPLFGLYADACVVSSRRLEKRLSRHFRHMHVLPTFVDHRRFTPAEGERPEGPVVFSWVGTIFQNFTRDNVLFILEAFARACDILGTRQGLRLDIVAGGDFFESVRETARTRFAGYPMDIRPWLAPEAMPAYLRSIDVGLYSLIDPSLFQESKSPTKIFEYYACAKPVISTAFGEARYFVEPSTGILADTVEDYARAMVRLFNEPETRRAMGLAGLARVRGGWNMESACQTLKQIVLPADEPSKER